MKKGLRWKIFLVVFIIALAIIFSYPPADKIHLGLDLKGGMHLVLQVMTDDTINMETNQDILRVKELFKKENIEYNTIAKGETGQFSIQEINPDQKNEIKDILNEYFKDWNFSIIGNTVSLTLRLNVAQYYRDQSVEMSRETIENRVDELGLVEPIIQRQGSGDRIILELPGAENPERIMNIIETTAVLEWRLVKAGPARDIETLLVDFEGKVPEDMEVMREDPRRKEEGEEAGYYLVSSISPVTGQDLLHARPTTDEWNEPSVRFTLNAEAGRRFYKFTGDNLGQLLSIVLDGKIQEVARIETRIPDTGIIHGSFTVESAEDLALVLRTGALPASIKYLEERTIGPSLGADSIRKGLFAIIMALFLVIIFMLIYYKLSGINAVIALILNIIILMGTLAYFKATLTLPGIAGIILTIGMAVDANVLVFERIREELSTGKSILSSIATGFSRAFKTILDANVTTIIAAIFLFQFGTGPIKGFAITIIIGITASMFTAVFVSRLIFDLSHSKRKKIEKLSI
ncbi:MAG: protein translocase subunit SecD [Candidatus Aminicenantaceae bacterium]